MLHLILGAAALQCVRANSFSDSLVERSKEECSPGGASANSPALQRREKWERYASPGGTTEVLTHTLQRCITGVFSSTAAEGRWSLQRDFSAAC